MTTISGAERERIVRDLDDKGYAIIDGVISHQECDELADKYKAWLSTFENGEFPQNSRSIIHGYGVAHMDPTWRIRLKAKPVFESIYGTPKLLSSMDGIGILPPAKQKQEFDRGVFWLHCDQSCDKPGHHSIQGAVYLEQTTEQDYCLRVLSGSHRKHQKFFNNPDHARAKLKSHSTDYYRLTNEEIQWYTDNGCDVRHACVPKGGMVLWDSRTIHDTKPPTEGRQFPERWRMLTFVSMAPASWAFHVDLKVKRKAYQNLETTAHWASRNVHILSFMGEGKHKRVRDLCLSQQPEIAKTREVKQLVGLKPYPFDDVTSNGPPPPIERFNDKRNQADLISLFTALTVSPPERDTMAVYESGNEPVAATVAKCSSGNSGVCTIDGSCSADRGFKERKDKRKGPRVKIGC